VPPAHRKENNLMAKKLILLLLLIPVIVMISLFAATKTISIMVDVPVSGISVNEADTHLYLNLDKEETHTLDYTVYPTNAKNKTVTATSEPVKDKSEAKLDFELADGKVTIKPKSPGSATVYLTTADGGYRKSVTVHVKSTAITGISGEAVKDGKPIDKLKVNESASIHTLFSPKAPSDSSLTYKSSNENILTVDSNGQVKALRSGSAKITVSSNFNPEYSYELTINVYNDYTLSLSGKETTMSESGKMDIDTSLEEFDVSKLKLYAYRVISETEKELLDDSTIELLLTGSKEENNLAIDYTFANELEVGTFIIEMVYEDEFNPVTASLEFTKSFNLGISFINQGKEVTEIMVDAWTSSIKLGIATNPSDAKCSFSVTSDNTTVIENPRVLKLPAGTQITYNTLSPGVATLTVTATCNGVSTEAKIKIYVSPGEAFSIATPTISFEDKNAGGDSNEFNPHKFDRSPIESLITIGRYEYDENGNLVSTQNVSAHRLVLNFLYENSDKFSTDPSFVANLHWSAAAYDDNGNPVSTDKIYVSSDGVVCFNDQTDAFSGTVKFTLTFGNGDNSVFASYELRCVSSAINVYSYSDLLRATTVNSSMSIVLRNHVSRDFGYYVNENGDTVPYYVEIPTTYDNQYYINEKIENQATVKILLEFRSSVYGNGHTINAHNVAYGLDSAGTPTGLFKGPLNFVAVRGTGSSAGNAISVKGQDNICFAVYDNVTLNNVQLMGASLEASAETNQIDLGRLTYSGTVVEALGDNISIEYSRIMNGRTVIRAFGAKDNPEKPIHMSIKNTILSGAREFIMRVGSNRFTENGTFENPSPAIVPADSSVSNADAHNAKTAYNTSYSEKQREDHDNNFINTFITIEDSILKNTGLFAIGVDSHFAGPSLANGNTFVYSDTVFKNVLETDKQNKKTMLDSWLGLAKTSYGVKVKFVGTVDMCTWKPISDVDSSSLIDVPAGNVEGALGTLKSMLNFDIKMMIETIAKKGGYGAILDSDKNIHGGVAFFGGGKNYGVLDLTETDAAFQKDIHTYSIPFSELGNQSFLHLAAGDEPFYFFMFDAKSSFKYSTQQSYKDDWINK